MIALNPSAEIRWRVSCALLPRIEFALISECVIRAERFTTHGLLFPFMYELRRVLGQPSSVGVNGSGPRVACDAVDKVRPEGVFSKDTRLARSNKYNTDVTDCRAVREVSNRHF
jgi:hypothetical protein